MPITIGGSAMGWLTVSVKSEGSVYIQDKESGSVIEITVTPRPHEHASKVSIKADKRFQISRKPIKAPEAIAEPASRSILG